MKFFGLHIVSLVLAGFNLVQEASGQAEEIRHCVTTDGNARVFVQHLHGDTTPTTSDTLTLQDNTPGYPVQTHTSTPTGWMHNVLDVASGLPGCSATVSDSIQACGSYDSYTVHDTGCNAGKGGKIEFLDRHRPDCGNNRALKSWFVTSNGCGGDGFRIQYYCGRITEATGTPVQRTTGCQASYGHTLEFLDRFNVQCQPNELMQSFSITDGGCVKPGMQIHYTCVPISSGPGSACDNYYTGCNLINGQPLQNLDRHQLNCPSHRPFLKAYQLSSDGCGGGDQQYRYECCSPQTSPPTDWVWYDFDAVHVLPGGSIGGDYTLLTGNNMVREGCPALLPATLNPFDNAPDPTTKEKIKAVAWEKTRTETINMWSPHMMAKAEPLELFALTDPFRGEGTSTRRRQLSSSDSDDDSNEKKDDADVIVQVSANATANANTTIKEKKKQKKFYTIRDSRWVSDATRLDVNATGAGTAMAEASGRLLFMLGDRAASCSATAVTDYGSPDRSLIVTAAHCIYDEKTKIFASYILFIPGIDQGGHSVSKRDCTYYKYGCWIPEFALVDSEWASNLNDVVHDFGFLVVKNKGAHVGPGGRNLALEDTVRTVDMDWNNKAALEVNQPVYTMGLPGTWSAELRYSKGALKQKHGLHFTYGCNLVEGASGGAMPLNPFDENPKLFSVNSFKSGYWEGDTFVQTACGGPHISGNSFCALLQASEEAEFGSAESVTNGGLIHPYEPEKGCVLPGWCNSDAECDDGIFCNGEETCVDNHCKAGADPCEGFRCDKETQECLPPCVEDSDCDDGVFCNGAETCGADGRCVAGGGNPCAEAEMCNPISDKCTAAECTQASDCNPSGLFCQGKGMCMDGQCHVIKTCEPDEKCDELSRQCELATCFLLKEQDFCLEDDNNECCICLDYCGVQEAEVIECAPMLFWPWFPSLDGPEDDELESDYDIDYDLTRYLQVLDDGNLTTNGTTLDLNATTRSAQGPKLEPTCLMWSLFMDGIWGEKPKTLLG